MSDQEIKELIEFNELWWGAVQEGEPIAQDEIEVVREITALAKSQQQQIDQQKKYIGFLQSACRSGEPWDGTFADFIKRISTEGVIVHE